METIEYTPPAGTRIRDACHEAVIMSNDKNCKVKLMFNDIHIETGPGRSAGFLEREWNAKRDQAAKEYRESEIGMADAKRREEDITMNQRKAWELLETLESVVEDYDALITWLKDFTVHADHIGVNFSKASLTEKLESAGFEKNEHVGKPSEWFSTRMRMAHYIVGQAISCLHSGMPPHPVTGSFVDRYFALPKYSEIGGAE